MNKQLSIILSILTIILVAVGIWWFATQSNEDGEPESQQRTDQSSTEVDEASDDEVPTGLAGTVTVDGVSYTINETTRCEPFEDDQLAMVERELELQGFGVQDGERVQIDVTIQTISGMQNNSISWSGPEGVYGMGETQSADVSQTDGRVTGSAELVDARTFTESINISFDLEVPSSTFSCR